MAVDPGRDRFWCLNPDLFSEWTAALRAAALSSRIPFIAIAAAREGLSDWTPLEVAPASDEILTAALARARILKPGSETLDAFYQGCDLDSYEPQTTFPLHPATVRILAKLADLPDGLIRIATILRQTVANCGNLTRVLYPCDLFESSTFSSEVERRLGGAVRAAFDRATNRFSRRADSPRRASDALHRRSGSSSGR